MTEDEKGRAVVDRRTLLPPPLPLSLSLAEMLQMEEDVNEVVIFYSIGRLYCDYSAPESVFVLNQRLCL